MAAAIAARAPAGLLDAGVLVPVPGQPGRQPQARLQPGARDRATRWRGLTGLAVVGAAAPLRPCAPQVGLGAGRAPGATRGARSACRPGVPPGGRAILVDDVYTTGATLDACALALRGRRRGEAVAVCFARTVRKRPGPVAHGPGGHVAWWASHFGGQREVDSENRDQRPQHRRHRRRSGSTWRSASRPGSASRSRISRSWTSSSSRSTRRAGRRGHAAAQGRHAAGARGLQRPDALRRPRGRQAGPPGQAPSRQAPGPPGAERAGGDAAARVRLEQPISGCRAGLRPARRRSTRC